MTYHVRVGGNFVIGLVPSPIQPTSISEVEWELDVGKSGDIWLYRNGESDVWFSDSRNQRGMGGREVTFKLSRNRGSITLKGVWNSNTDAFFQDTGKDHRNFHLTWGCVGTELSADSNSGKSSIKNLIWIDERPVKGSFNRVEDIASILARRYVANYKQRIYYYVESAGGSSYGMVHVDDAILEKYGMLERA